MCIRDRPCHSSHTRSLVMIPPDSCRDNFRCLRQKTPDHKQAPPWPDRRRNHTDQATRDHRSNLPDSKKSCLPTETAGRLTCPAPPSPTPPPSATDTRWHPSSRIPSCRFVPSYKPASFPHSYNNTASVPLAPTVHCTTSRNQTSPPSAPDDSPPSPNPHKQRHT